MPYSCAKKNSVSVTFRAYNATFMQNNITRRLNEHGWTAGMIQLQFVAYI